MDKSSLLNFYKTLIRLRKENPALHAGEWKPIINGQGGVLIYFRTYLDQKIMIVLNFTSKKRRISVLINETFEVLFSNHRNQKELPNIKNVIIKPIEVTLLQKLA
jgi:alpha-glucosidase